MSKINIIFQPIDNSPDMIFAEIEDENGKSIKAGEWLSAGRYEYLIIDCDQFTTALLHPHQAILDKIEELHKLTLATVQPRGLTELETALREWKGIPYSELNADMKLSEAIEDYFANKR